MTSKIRRSTQGPARRRRWLAMIGALALVSGVSPQAGAVSDGERTCGGVDSLGSINNAPLAVDDETWVEPEGSVVVAVLDNDQDFDGDDLSVVDVLPAGHGLAAIVEGTVEYQPGLGFEGLDTFRYVVSDGRCGIQQATVRITVSDTPPPPDEAVPDPPVVAEIQFTG